MTDTDFLLNPETWQPPTQSVSCGNRTDLFKKQRRHDFRCAGIDVRHTGQFGEMTEMLVFICQTCGREQEHEPGTCWRCGKRPHRTLLSVCHPCLTDLADQFWTVFNA